MENKLKIVLCLLIVVLVGIIAFVGVYSKGLISYESNLPDYTFASELTGKRITYFTLDTSEEEIIYDQDGNEVDEIPEDADEDDYVIEKVKVNADEDLTTENYKLSKEIFEGRLNELGVEDYTIKLNEENGDMIIELSDDTITDTLLKYLLCQGDFSMTDSEDGTVLLDKSDVKTASIMYGSSDTGATVVYLYIKFTNEGTKKLEEVSREYLKIEETDDEESEDNDSDETTEDETQKKVTLKIEGSELLTTYFGEEISSGELTISLGSSADTETLYEYISQAQVYAMLINNEEMPLSYTIEMSQYYESDIGNEALYIIFGIVIGIATIIVIYMIARYRADGLVCGVSFVAAVAIFLILLRYTATTITLGSVAGVLVLLVFDTYFMLEILKSIKENSNAENVSFVTYAVYLQKLDLIIVFLIIAVVFTFMSNVLVYSIGMTLFYGIISLIIANLAIMRNLLIAKHK